MKSDIESLDMEDHYRHMYKENMEILQQINVVSTLSNKDNFFLLLLFCTEFIKQTWHFIAFCNKLNTISTNIRF